MPNPQIPLEGIVMGAEALRSTAHGAVKLYHSEISTLGGTARMSGLSAQQRTVLARKAGNARWIKYRRKQRQIRILRKIYDEITEFMAAKVAAEVVT